MKKHTLTKEEKELFIKLIELLSSNDTETKKLGYKLAIEEVNFLIGFTIFNGYSRYIISINDYLKRVFASRLAYYRDISYDTPDYMATVLYHCLARIITNGYYYL